MRTNTYASINKVRDYLYSVNYLDVDYDFAYQYFKTKAPVPNLGACSSIRQGTYLGRNLDWLYSESAEFVVRTPETADHYAVMGVASNIPTLTKNFVESGDYSQLYKIVPFMLVDGVNSAGVSVSTNVVPQEKGDNSIVYPYRFADFEICTLMIPRFVLDMFSSARAAVSYLKDFAKIYLPKSLVEDYKYDQHFIIADRFSTYLVEFIDGELVYSEISDRPYMTNFHLTGVIFNDDGYIYTPETQDAEHNAKITNEITDHGSGLERYNLITKAIIDLELQNKDDMRALLNKLLYSNSYKSETDPYWYTEFVDDDLTVISDLTDYADTVVAAQALFVQRSRDPEDEHFGTWQSTHSSIYDMELGKLFIVAQEDMSNEYEFTFLQEEDMVPSVIIVKVDNQYARIRDLKTIASGGVGSAKLKFEFNGSWEGLEKKVMFYREAGTYEYAEVDTNNECVIPTNTIATAGKVHFAVYGKEGDYIYPSTAETFEVKEGVVVEVVEPDPAPENVTP